MKLLLTRSREQSEVLAATFRAKGIEVWIEPMLSIVPETNINFDPRDYQALLVTSANGATALAKVTRQRESEIYAVGRITAETLSGHGFENVYSADGDVNDLIKLVMQHVSREAGGLLHVGGRNLAGRLVEQLRLKGFSAGRIALYRAVAAGRLSVDVRQALGRGDIDGVLFFSPRTARVFMKLAFEASCEKALLGMTAFCLSEAVCKAARPSSWGRVVVSDRSIGTNLVSAVMAAQ